MKSFFVLFISVFLTACGQTSQANWNFPAYVWQDLQEQRSIGVRHERPVIDADTQMWVIGTKFYRGLGGQVFLLNSPKQVPAGYSGHPVHKTPRLTIPSYPGWYCIIYAPMEGGQSCLSRAKKEGDTIRLRSDECRQSCDRW